MSGLVLDKLSKTFSNGKSAITALKELSLTIQHNELLALVGPSGCGKTTALRLIAGLEEPSRGSIFIDGKSVDSVPAKDRDVAMVFQSPALFPHLTVLENLSFGLKLRKIPRAEITERVNQAAEILGLKNKLQCRPQELSGGEAQRVSLGRALVRQPKVFLLDEPLSAVDAPTRKKLRAEIVQLQKILAVPMVYVTHDQREALAIGQRLAILHQGELQQIGTAQEILAKPANDFVTEFFSEL
ncbi:MAG: ABC transporter ATP-binding protein [Verrucomicrobiota bacterium]